jgi:hypothetical protein
MDGADRNGGRKEKLVWQNFSGATNQRSKKANLNCTSIAGKLDEMRGMCNLSRINNAPNLKPNKCRPFKNGTKATGRHKRQPSASLLVNKEQVQFVVENAGIA